MTFQKAPKADYFGSFLDSLEKSAAPGPQPEASEASPEPNPPVPPDPGSPAASESPVANVIRMLAAKGPIQLPDLAAALGQSVLVAADLVAKLVKAGLVSEDGPPGQERYALTDQGQIVTEVA